MFIKFLKRLIKDANQKIFLIIDNLRVHHAYVVKDWLENHKDEIELFFLPSYSPELNPDEYLNCDLKSRCSFRSSCKNKRSTEKQSNLASANASKETEKSQKVLQTSQNFLCSLIRLLGCRVNNTMAPAA